MQKSGLHNDTGKGTVYMEKKKILISFLDHRETDGRVFYRELRTIGHFFTDSLSISIVSIVKSNDCASFSVEEDDIVYEGNPIHIYRIIRPAGFSKAEKVKIQFQLHREIRKLLKMVNPDFYFIADVREVNDAVRCYWKKDTVLIYDSHEDYVRQALDYGSGIKKYYDGFCFYLTERRNLRKFDAVFCTDEHLLGKYSQPRYHAKKVHLLRNYPYYDARFSEFTREFAFHDTLKMVYIGGVDKYRGIIESVEYIQQFNQETEGKRITLDVYGNDTEIAKAVSTASNVFFHDWIDQSVLMEKLKTEYDVGLCLWQPIPKFFLNLPIKNFDYMGAGLPFITSNFGNLKIHAEKSRAGFCIEPTSYEEFKQAALKLFDPNIRKKLSDNGLRYVKEEASFQTEAKPLIELIQERI